MPGLQLYADVEFFGFDLHHSLELDVLIHHCNLSLAAVSLKFTVQKFSQIDRISLVQSYRCISNGS